MAKSKNSKILAMALCASVMAGIYATPVMAADEDVNVIEGKLTVVKNEDSVYFLGEGTLKLNGSDIAAALSDIDLNVKSVAAGTISATDDVKVGTYSLKSIGANTAGIVRQDVNGTVGKTEIEGTLVVNGNTKVISNASATFVVDGNGNITDVGNVKSNGVVTSKELHVEGQSGSFNVADVTNGSESNTMIYVQDGQNNDTLRIDTQTGNLATKGEVRVGEGAFVANNTGIAVGVDKFAVDAATGNVATKGEVRAGEGAFVANNTGIAVGKNFAVNAANGGVQAVEYKVNDNNVLNASGLKATKVTADSGTIGKVEIADGKVDGVDVSELGTNVGVLNTKTQNIDAANTDSSKTTFNGSVIADSFKTQNNKFYVTADGAMVAANGNFKVANDGTTTATNFVTTSGADLNQVSGNTAAITRTQNENGVYKTTVSDRLYVDSITQNTGGFWISDNGQASLSRGQVMIDYNGNITLESKVAGQGNIILSDGATVDGVDVSELDKTVSGTTVDIRELQDKTQNMWAGKNYTTFKGSLSTEGSISAGNGAVQLRGNWGQEAAIDLKDAEGNYSTLTATKLGTINNVIDDEGNVEGTTVKTASGADLDEVNSRTQNMTAESGVTNFTGDVAVEGGFSAANGLFTLDNDGSIYARQDDATFNFDANNVSLANAGNSLSITDNQMTLSSGANSQLVLNHEGLNYNNDAFTVAENGTVRIHGDKYITLNADTGVVNAANFETGQYNLNSIGESLTTLKGEFDTTNANVAGIKRTGSDEEGWTTTVEEATSFNEDGMVIGDNAIVANADGSFSAANGLFDVSSDGIVTINNPDPFGDKVQIGAGLISVGETEINGFGVVTPYVEATSGEIGGVEIDGGLVDGVDVSEIGDMVAADGTLGGITREDRLENITGLDTTVIEGTLSVNEEAVGLFDDSLTFNYGTTGSEPVVNVSGKLNFVNGADVSFGYTNNDNVFTSTNLEELANKLDDVYGRTEHISVDENGNTTISSPSGDTTLTVADDGVKVNGNGEIGGDAAVDGSLTVGDTEGSQTIIEDNTVNTGTVNANEGNFAEKVTIGTEGNQTVIEGGTITTGETTITNTGITVGNGENATSITNDTVKAQNGYFDNIKANTGTIGGVEMKDGNISAESGTIGNTTINNEGVSIADSTIISDHDVVVNSGKEDQVSLVDVGNRVGNLEQGLSDINNRVDHLEDRIDKVGAMAAAIANLRTMGYDPAAPTEVAVGLGQYRDETGAALGLFHYPNRDFMLSLSVSTSGDEVMGGIGATWKFGRKSPEKVAEIKKAQAEADVRRAEAQKLAKAEELKEAAREAKIKAQQERHAKLAAERAAQAEAK